ncbi:Polygalacturonase inhibitor-like protein [Drosera capensis]
MEKVRFTSLNSMYSSRFIFFIVLLIGYASTSETCNPIDYRALRELLEAMGNTPHLVSSFNLDADCCKGWAITCSPNNGRVTFFLASMGNTSSVIPSSIADMEYLEAFQIILSPVYGSIPASISKLKYLRSIRISSTNLNSTIPSFLGEMSTLENIDLSSSNLIGTIPPSLGNLNSLTRLVLCCNKLTGHIPETLGSCIKLESLDLSDNQLSGFVPRSFGNLGLRDIALSLNHLEGDASFFFGVDKASLWSLRLSRNQFSFNLSVVSIPPSLSTLDISENQIYGSIPTALAYETWDMFNMVKDTSMSSLKLLCISFFLLSSIPSTEPCTPQTTKFYMRYRKPWEARLIWCPRSTWPTNAATARPYRATRMDEQRPSLPQRGTHRPRSLLSQPTGVPTVLSPRTIPQSSQWSNTQVPRILALQILDFSKKQLTGNVSRSLGHVSIPNLALGSIQLTGDASHLFQNNTSNLFLYRNIFEFNFSNVIVEETLNYFDISNNLVYGGLPSEHRQSSVRELQWER